MHPTLRLSILFLFLFPIGTKAQELKTSAPGMFQSELIKSQSIYQANLFRSVLPNPSTDPGDGHVMRVVGSPLRTFYFNSDGEVIREQQFHSETGRMNSDIRWQKGMAQLPNGEQKTLVLRQDIRVYTYRTEGLADSLLALHQFTEFGYDRNGRLNWERKSEKSSSRTIKLDSTHYHYEEGSGRKVQQEVFRFYEGGENETIAYGLLQDNQMKWTSDLDREKLFTYSESMELAGTHATYTDFEHDWKYFYKSERLDSTSFRATFSSGKEPYEYGVRNFYDKSGKLVLIRTTYGPENIQEELLEYLSK